MAPRDRVELFAAMMGAALVAAMPASAFDPVSLLAPNAPIELKVLASYRGGKFSNRTPASPPAYDPVTKRLYVGSVDRMAVEFLDVSHPDPETPLTKLQAIDLTPYGEPNSLALHKGLLAVAVKDPDRHANSGKVLLFGVASATGVEPKLAAPSIELPRELGAPGRLAFATSGHRLVVTLPGTAPDDCNSNDCDPEARIAIIDLGPSNWSGCTVLAAKCHVEPTLRIANFTGYDTRETELINAGVRIYGPPRIGPSVAQAMDPAALAVSPNAKLAWISLQRNNAIAKVNLENAQVAEIFALGSKDHSVTVNGVHVNGFDTSDRGGIINIKDWPVRSFYSPDGIAAVGPEQTFLITVNEGDPIDITDGYSEKVRLNTLTLDQQEFPNAATLQQNNNLGRLQVTNVNGNIDNDPAFEQIYMLGSRSFSVWTTEGQLLFDSGEDFEQKTRSALPHCLDTPPAGCFFNTGEDEIVLKSRSDDRGPEPEHLAVGRIGAREFLFITFERIGGVIVYDITQPIAPVFVQYINNRDFTLDPKDPLVCPAKGSPITPSCELVGDMEPDGLLFIDGEASPISGGVPLLAVIHELSDSTTLFRIDETSSGP